jgi:hypothetical protein
MKSTLTFKSSDSLLLAFTGLDGYFRIIEMRAMDPLFSFRSDYGGFSSFAFNQTYSMVCLAGQDDTTYVVHFEQKVTWLKLQGHNSFISRAVFSTESEALVRVISGSYDGYLSFTELGMEIFAKMRVLMIISTLRRQSSHRATASSGIRMLTWCLCRIRY